jgi:hypothetical protein
VDWSVVYGAIDHIHEVFGDAITGVGIWAYNRPSCVSVMIAFRDSWTGYTNWCFIYRSGDIEWR